MFVCGMKRNLSAELSAARLSSATIRGATHTPSLAMVETMAAKLQWRHANFLPHRNRADGNLGPAAHGLCHPTGFARQLNSGLLAKSERANVLVKTVFSKPQARS